MRVPIIDQHCHPPYKPLPVNATHVLTTCCRESHDTDMLRQHVPHTLFFCRAVSDLAAWFVSAGRIEATTAINEGKQVNVLWQEAESLTFIANGRSYRSEFHINPYSPRFPPGAFALISERKRRPGEKDCFLWFCDHCKALVYEAVFEVSDYTLNPVSTAYREYYDSVAHRTCKACGYLMPTPDDHSYTQLNPTLTPEQVKVQPTSGE